MDKVFGNNDLRKYIFTYLRKFAKLRCLRCYDVLIWDKEVKDYEYIRGDDKFTNYRKHYYYCIDCYNYYCSNNYY
jgi:hypothetical protein